MVEGQGDGYEYPLVTVEVKGILIEYNTLNCIIMLELVSLIMVRCACAEGIYTVVGLCATMCTGKLMILVFVIRRLYCKYSFLCACHIWCSGILVRMPVLLA